MIAKNHYLCYNKNGDNMIYTLTYNPSIDYSVLLKNDYKIGEINRTSEENTYVGGKGINVARILKALNKDVVCLGFVAGFVGEMLESQLNEMGVKSDFIKVQKGNTRINVKIRNDESEINGNGPVINQSDIEKLIDKISRLDSEDYLMVSGSIPSSVSIDQYIKVIECARRQNVNLVIDSEGEKLLLTLRYKPFLIKPNKIELEEIMKMKLSTEDDIVFAANFLKDKGAQNVLVSLGKDGAILIDENNDKHVVKAKEVNVVNTVGAGDSMVASFISTYIDTKDFDKSLEESARISAISVQSKELIDLEYI